jgi:hypothetical protein
LAGIPRFRFIPDESGTSERPGKPRHDSLTTIEKIGARSSDVVRTRRKNSGET